MVKRFCDNEIWNKDWFLNLSDKQKLLTKFIFDACDCAGIYEISWRMLKVFFASEITREDFEAIKQIKFIDENTVFVEDFVLFQCSIKNLNDLNPNNNAHKGIIKRLNKYNLLQAPNEPLTSPSLGAHSGAQEMEKEKEDITCNLNFENCFKIYQENCKNLLPLCFERRSKAVLEELNTFLIEIDYNFEYFQNLCKKANSLKTIVDKKIDFRSMVRNHIGITNGKYIQKPPEKSEPRGMNYTPDEPISEKMRHIKETASEMPESFKELKKELKRIASG